MPNILIIYYSFEGNTEIIAKSIAEMTQGELLNIKPIKELKSKGFSKYFWGGSQIYMKKKPELVSFDKDISNYETIFIGTPIWAGTFAPPVKTLLDYEKLKGKQVYFFYTHAGGPGKVEKIARESIEPNNTLLSSKGFVNVEKHIEENILEVKKWLSSLSL